MAFPLIHLLFYISLLTHGALALQVTPNSPCASFCLDNPELDPSDPNSSNTNSADIVCQNADYNTTSAGTKFMACVNCLQTSTYSSGEEDDQSWFICKLELSNDGKDLLITSNFRQPAICSRQLCVFTFECFLNAMHFTRFLRPPSIFSRRWESCAR